MANMLSFRLRCKNDNLRDVAIQQHRKETKNKENLRVFWEGHVELFYRSVRQS